jgi:hypothetical protein
LACVATDGGETAAAVVVGYIATDGGEAAVVVVPGLDCAAPGGDETAVVAAVGLVCIAKGGDETAVVVASGLVFAAAGDETAIKPLTEVKSSSAWLSLVTRMLQPHISTHLINARQKCEARPHLWLPDQVGQRANAGFGAGITGAPRVGFLPHRRGKQGRRSVNA